MITTVAIVSLGCPKNTADSDMLAGLLSNAGFDLVALPEQADAVIVNTCGFIRPACEESLDTIMELASLKREGRLKRLLVCGCLSERYGEELRRELPEADRLFGVAEKDCHSILSELMNARDVRVTPSPRRIPAGPYAYVKISEGCDRSCSFCTIPWIRGGYRSRPQAEIEAEVELLVGHGIKEMVLVGQDTGAWGEDTGGVSRLPALLESLASRFDAWFRLMYLQPDRVGEDLIDTIAAHANVCDYFDIPFQHASEQVLRRMGRWGSEEEFLGLISGIRSALPQAAIRTSLIVGFPGETERDFEVLAGFVRRARFDYAGLFLFSPEEGTLAAKLDGGVQESVALERHRMLGDLADDIGWDRLRRRKGARLDVLVEGISDEEGGASRGRSQYQAPEVDGECLIRNLRARVGEVVGVSVTGTDDYDMICERA
ncbi:MAG: 30S ribosomal protein S12 methylthiotransferase RimO [Actinobacteria bacterium]|nr:MAG: 30S ribosomal protein S12 methylthiotransferase RimO [Actinomycetota bacterium]